MTVYVLCAIIVFQSVIYYIERRDLYSRIGGDDTVKTKGKPPTAAKSIHEQRLREWRRKGGDG